MISGDVIVLIFFLVCAYIFVGADVVKAAKSHFKRSADIEKSLAVINKTLSAINEKLENKD